MMDFEAQGGNEFDSADLAQAGGEGTSPVAGVGTRVVLAPDGQGVVVLPEGVSLEDIQIQGRDLVVLAADGTRYVIPEGGITVPQIEVDGVAVPPLNLAALLLGNEPQPAAGPLQSSGGNFADPAGLLQDAFGLGDLLPYTELEFPEEDEREVIPDFVNRRPDISIEPDDSGVSVINAQDAVDEAGLPARGGEPAGSNSAADSEGTYGFINFSSPDGTSEVAINGVAITQVGQTFSTPFGVLTITSIADGRIGYSYTLADNTTDPASEDRFTVTITDADGDTATASLRITIIDDVPTASDDTDTVPAGSYAAIGGNVITGQGTDSGAAGADTVGADDARVSAVANSSGQSVSGNGALVIQGAYGTLTLNGDGSYSYVRAPGTPGGSTETFTYTLTDGDGDTSTATLTINIDDAPATVISVPDVGDGTIVDESGLPERDGEAPGSAEPSDVETTSGTITFAAPDGVASVTINGVVITGAGQQIQLPEGTLTIVSYDPVGGTLEYSFTLADNTGGDTTQVELTVTVTDTDGDSDSEDFVIVVIDDTPAAVDDVAAQGAENAPVTVEVFANDTPGADSVDLTSGVTLVDGTLTGAGTVTYNNDGTFTYTPAPGEEGTVTFDYTITDGDGDTSTATVTITLAADATPTIDVIEARGGAVVHEAGLPTGSDAAADSETTAGTIAIATGNDTVGSLVINGTDVTGGGTVAGAHGTLTVTVTGGVYSYSYTLAANTDGDDTQDVFTVTVTDSDGDSASAPLVIDIVDDVPTARADADSVSEDGTLIADGNVLTGSGGSDANATDGTADTQGADGAVVTTTGSFAGLHGTLVLNADGSYTYTLNGTDTAVQGLSAGETLTDVFSYTIQDGDGDTSSATLTITINGSDAGVTINGLDAVGAEETVDEDDLPDGSSPDAAALTQTGTFDFSSPDGLDDVTIGGTQVVTDGVFTAGLTASSAFGTVTITGFTPVLGADGSIIGGTFTYSYALGDNTLSHSSAGQDSVTDSFAVTVTDTDGSSATASLDVRVIDDVPTAQADTNSVQEGAVVAGNVLGNDEFGADGSAPGGAVTGVAAGSDASNPVTGGVGGVIVGAYGTLTLHANGSYTYDGTPNSVPPAGATDTFVYTITDGDGDTSTVTLTINLTDSGPPLAASSEDASVDEAALAIGSNPLSDGETVTGTLTDNVSGGTGAYTFALVGSGIGTNGTLTLNANGSWSYTLAAPVDGATADNSTNTVNNVETFTYQVTDADGNTTTNTLTIDVIDDVPTAANDSETQTAENTPIVIDALANDAFGADGVATGDPASVSVATQPTYGTVTYDPGTGLFTYVPDAGAGSISTTDSFTYTIVDGDGDTSTATVTLTLTADSRPVVEAVTAAVDDDALGGSDLSTSGDMDANAGEDPFSLSEAVFNGKIDVDFGADGGSVTLANLDGTAGQVGSEAVTYGWDEGSRTLTATSARGALFSVTLDADGTYTVTLLNNVLHAAGGDEANAPAVVLNYLATDNDDSDTDATGTLTITFNDDAPFATDNAATVEEGATVTGGNVLTDGTPDEFGADGAVVPGGGVVGFAQGATTAAAGGSIVTALGTLTLHADGSYTYVAKANTITVDTTDTFTYTIEDGDGDQSTATLTINISAVTGTVSDDNVLVNEAGLDGIGSAGATDSETDSIGGITATGGTPPYTYVITPPASPVGTLTVNADGTYSYTLNGPIDGPTAADGAQTLLNVESYGYEVYDANNNLIGSGNIVIDVIDDVPTAANDSETQTAENTPIVIDALANDVFGADGVATGDPASVFVASQPTYGTVTYDPGTGLFTYVPDAGAGSLSTTDSFTYTITDGDGDTSTATATITLLADSTPTAVVASDLTVDEDGFGFANADASPLQTDPAETDSTESLTDAGSVVVSFGNDVPADPLAAFTLLDTAGLDGQLTALDGTPVTFALVGGALVGSAGGTEVIRVTVTGAVAGPGAGQVTYSYAVQLSQPVQHTGQGEGSALLSGISFQVTDSDGDQLPAAGTFDVTIVDDVPTAVDDSASIAAGQFGPVTGDVLANDETGADGAAVSAVASDNVPANSDNTPNGSGDFQVAGQYGTLTLNTDGSYSYTRAAGSPGGVSDVFTYTLTDGDGDTTTATLTIDIGNAAPIVGSNATVLLDDDALLGGIAGGTGDDADAVNLIGTLSGSGGDGALAWAFQLTGAPVGFTYESDGAGGILIKQGGTTVVTVTLNAATGAYQATQVAAVKHAAGGDENNQIFTLNYTVTDADGESAPGTLTIDVDDDGPTAIAPVAVTIDNTVGGTGTAYLDGDLDVDGNFGADGGKVVFTSATIAALEAQGLTSSLASLEYTVSPDGTVLTATKSTDDSTVFTIALQPGGHDDQYVVTMFKPLDSKQTVEFFDDSYDFVGGNDPWAGFVPDGQDDVPVNDDSQDLLLTPFAADSTSGNAINLNAHSAGVSGGGGGQNVGTHEGIRLDFVTDLTGNPAGNPANYDYYPAGQQDHRFDNHYQVNDVSLRFGDGSTNTTISIKAFDANDLNDVVYHNGTLVNVTQIVISFDGENQVFDFDSSQLTQTLSVGSPGGSTDRSYTVTWVESSPGSGVYSVQVTGILDQAVRVATHGEKSYEALEVQHLSGDDFAITGFGAATIANEPVPFTVPVSIQDGDGDTAAGGVLEITAEPPTTPPVVLDLDGDGVEFVGLSAGIAFDYDGDGTATSTAWAGADDGLLVHDANSNRAADDGSEIVFGGNGLTDLEGLAAKYDSNGDGVLDAQDAEFAGFGVWQDANGNGVTDAGEFATLAEAGITSINLVSDGQAYGAAGGDVHVHGTAVYTRADGSTGLAADAEFATGAEQKAAQRTAETVVTAAAAGALLMPEPVLAHDQRTIADEPLERVDAGLLELGAQDTAGFAEDTDLSTKTDLFDAAEQVQPETAERTADRSAEDFAPTMADAAPEAHSGSDPLGSASEPVADFGGSAFTGFHGDASGGAIMDALLALQAAPAQPAASADAAANPAVTEALGEVADGAAVDAIVDHYAGGENAAPANSGGEIDSAVLLQALDGHVFLAGNGSVVPDAMEDAALMAAAVQA